MFCFVFLANLMAAFDTWLRHNLGLHIPIGLSGSGPSSASYAASCLCVPGRQQVIVQVTGSLPPRWETRKSSQLLPLTWPITGMGQGGNRMDLCVSLSLLLLHPPLMSF